MKKIFSVFLAVMMLFSFSAVSSADGEKEYNWTDVESSIGSIMGKDAIFWKFDEVDAILALPYAFSAVQLSDDDISGGCTAFLISEENDDEFLICYYIDSNGVTLDSLYSYYIQNGIRAEKVLVNSIPAVLQHDEANNSLILTFLTQENKLFQVIFSPLSSEEALYQYVIASIQPVSMYNKDKADTEEVPADAPVNPVSGLISK